MGVLVVRGHRSLYDRFPQLLTHSDYFYSGTICNTNEGKRSADVEMPSKFSNVSDASLHTYILNAIKYFYVAATISAVTYVTANCYDGGIVAAASAGIKNPAYGDERSEISGQLLYLHRNGYAIFY
jgi:hypothetical protein